VTEGGHGSFADRQTVLRQQLGDGAVRRALLAKLHDDFFGRSQGLELLRTAWREFIDCLADGR
jgi:hypothetical protein